VRDTLVVEVTLEHRIEEIKEYFKNWIIENATHDPDIIEFLKDPKIVSDDNDAWMNIYDTVHEKAFQDYLIIDSPDAAKAFLGEEAEAIKEFVLEWEQERYEGLGDGRVQTNIFDDVALVQRYFFIHGEDIIAEWMEDPNNY